MPLLKWFKRVFSEIVPIIIYRHDPDCNLQKQKLCSRFRFLSLLQYCWALFSIESQSHWVFLEFVGLLTPPILLYLVASLLFPSSGGDLDMTRFYYSSRKPIFGLLAALMLFNSVHDWLVGQPLRSSDLIRAIGVAGYAVLFASSRPVIHATVSIGALASLIAFFVLAVRGYDPQRGLVRRVQRPV